MKRSFFFIIFFFPQRLPVNLSSTMIVCHVSFWLSQSSLHPHPRANLRDLRAGMGLMVGAGPRARPGLAGFAEQIGLISSWTSANWGWDCSATTGRKCFGILGGAAAQSVLSKPCWLRGQEGPQRATKIRWAPLFFLSLKLPRFSHSPLGRMVCEQ